MEGHGRHSQAESSWPTSPADPKPRAERESPTAPPPGRRARQTSSTSAAGSLGGKGFSLCGPAPSADVAPLAPFPVLAAPGAPDVLTSQTATVWVAEAAPREDAVADIGGAHTSWQLAAHRQAGVKGAGCVRPWTPHAGRRAVRGCFRQRRRHLLVDLQAERIPHSWNCVAHTHAKTRRVHVGLDVQGRQLLPLPLQLLLLQVVLEAFGEFQP
mmetsp:Transcript_81066/g.250182  ORF Transcript_81066/g.250182 Transcript_81066/m.250182 type:complete len:213 (-) Transcript_81066:102-740(-)